uniref:DUF4124 domain-containing protein n=1 Tax=Marinobacterium profundum TaxID=1714300 RepID=UPI0008319116|nr:DUF4124 domain-containing protein [Marinobacterium profundum]
MTFWRWCLWPLLICVSSAAMAGSVYRWRDETGVLHFSGVPPAGVAAEEVRLGRISVVSMTRSTSVGEVPVVPECAPGYSDDEVCESAQPSRALEPEPEVESPQDQLTPTRKHGEIRDDTLESRTEKLIDYNKRKQMEDVDKQGRIKEIKAERKLRAERRFTPGTRKPKDPETKATVRMVPKTVNKRLSEKNNVDASK